MFSYDCSNEDENKAVSTTNIAMIHSTLLHFRNSELEIV